MHYNTSETTDLFKAWAVLSVCFAIILTDNFSEIPIALVISAFTVGLGFVLHELAHRYFARRYHAHARFVANNTMLFLGLLMSLFGFILIAPGAVMMQGHISRRQRGIISLSGPATNLLLAILFIAPAFIFPNRFFSYGFMINAWIGLFNLIPFFGFDGKHVYEWSKPVYFSVASIAIILVAFSAI